jgi:hypothetical protein
MRDYINIGPTPTDEPCAQVGSDNYAEQSRKECIAFCNQLRRQFGEEPTAAHIALKSFPHDFGSYLEVVCYYDDYIPESVEYAYKLESETPAKWDKEARKELGI